MKTKMTSVVTLLIATSLLFVSGCGSSSDSGATSEDGGSKPIAVVCTTNVIKDLVRQIGGERVAVTAIMDGPGIDPHTYTPSPRDTNALTAADVVVYSGLHLEGQFDGALESLNNSGIPVICVTAALSSESPGRLIRSEGGLADPHVWFDPDLWATCGESLAAQLADFDPAGKQEYMAAAAAFAQQMAETKAAAIERLRSVPDDRRILVTAHDAFEYFSRAFQFQVEAVQGISTESEQVLRRVNELITLLSEKKIAAVFTEQSVSDKNISALIEGCHSRGHQLKIGGRLFSDTVCADGTPEGSLAGALLHNVNEIATALAADAELAQ